MRCFYIFVIIICFVGIRHLSTVGYSYWTIGYMLSQTGAQKLLKAKPLEKLIPVDEYIPIMFDRHPNATWKAAFANRNLLAFTVYPPLIRPEKYTNDEGYVSDTEDSSVVEHFDVSKLREEALETESHSLGEQSESMLVSLEGYNPDKTEL